MATQTGERNKKAGKNPKDVPSKLKRHGPRGKSIKGPKGFTIAKGPGGVRQVDFSVVRLKGGLTRKLFARMTGFSERAIAGWEAGEPVSEPAKRRLLETERFRERLSQVVKPDAIPEWLEAPNDAFGGLKPVEVIERGEIDRLWNMIFYMESGVPT